MDSLGLTETSVRDMLSGEQLATIVLKIVNGFEGERVDDPGSVYHGKHKRNGWKNLGLPCSYGHHPELM